jgi:hypothetical protein
MLAERAARYEQVWYFRSAQLHRDLGRALDTLEPGVRARFSLSRRPMGWGAVVVNKPGRVAGRILTPDERRDQHHNTEFLYGCCYRCNRTSLCSKHILLQDAFAQVRAS